MFNSKKIFIAFLLGFTLLAGSGCATVHTPAQMQKSVAGYHLPAQPTEGRAMVYVVRPTELGGLIRFNVFLNDSESKSEIGYTRGGQYIFFEVEAGANKIFSKAENMAEIELKTEPNLTYFIQQNVAMGFLMARNQLKLLSELEGKFFVQTTKLGTIHKPKTK